MRNTAPGHVIITRPDASRGTMRRMPAIPESTRSSNILRLLDHAEHNWPQLAKVAAALGQGLAYAAADRRLRRFAGGGDSVGLQRCGIREIYR